MFLYEINRTYQEKDIYNVVFACLSRYLRFVDVLMHILSIMEFSMSGELLYIIQYSI